VDEIDRLQRAALLRVLARSAAGGKIRELICAFSVWRGFSIVATRFCALGRAAPPLLVKTVARARDLRAAVAL
jgi:hypothetical protein